MLIRAGVDIARVEGGSAVTLARVAERCDVTKPIAYRLFIDLTDLLLQMRAEIARGYDAAVASAVDRVGGAEAAPRRLLASVVRSYMEHSLGDGAVYDTVSAAIVASLGMEEPPLSPSDLLGELSARLFGSGEHEVAARVMLISAADGLVVAVNAGLLTPERAIGRLEDLFVPLLVGGGRS